jgi:hypothetical protein
LNLGFGKTLGGYLESFGGFSRSLRFVEVMFGAPNNDYFMETKGKLSYYNLTLFGGERISLYICGYIVLGFWDEILLWLRRNKKKSSLSRLVDTVRNLRLFIFRILLPEIVFYTAHNWLHYKPRETGFLPWPTTRVL